MASWFNDITNTLSNTVSNVSNSVNIVKSYVLPTTLDEEAPEEENQEKERQFQTISTRCKQIIETAVNKLNGEIIPEGTRQFEEFANTTLESVSNTIHQLRESLPTYEVDLCTEVSFNQDCTALNVGFENGYALYSSRTVEGPIRVYRTQAPKNVHIIERLFGTSLIVFVSRDQPRKLSINNYHKNTQISQHSYSGSILSVKLNKKRVIVCLEESIYIYNITDMKLIHMIKEVPKNPPGLIALSSNADNCYLAYPSSSNIGIVHIFDTNSLTNISGFAAHNNPLAAMTFSPDGKKIATASKKGTVIRVFEVPSGARLFEFTRGLKRRATIYSLAFSSDSSLLSSSSNTETIHVFNLTQTETQENEEPQESLSSWVNYFSQQATAYLPTHMNELMLREKSFCTARLPMAGTKTVVGIPMINGKYYLFCASSDGYLFCFNLESVAGNECALIRQFRIGSRYGMDADPTTLDETLQFQTPLKPNIHQSCNISTQNENEGDIDSMYPFSNPEPLISLEFPPLQPVQLSVPLVQVIPIMENEEVLSTSLNVSNCEEVNDEQTEFMSVRSSFSSDDTDGLKMFD